MTAFNCTGQPYCWGIGHDCQGVPPGRLDEHGHEYDSDLLDLINDFHNKETA